MSEDAKVKLYEEVLAELDGIIGDEKNLIANLSNSAALLFEKLPDINWSGYYLFEDSSKELVLGPFQGRVACIRIKIGKGVCGTSFEKGETLVVPDVHAFPGHIACDSRSKSEIVVPLKKGDRQLGVLDIDAPIEKRFDEVDKKYLEKFVEILLRNEQ